MSLPRKLLHPTFTPAAAAFFLRSALTELSKLHEELNRLRVRVATPPDVPRQLLLPGSSSSDAGRQQQQQQLASGRSSEQSSSEAPASASALPCNNAAVASAATADAAAAATASAATAATASVLLSLVDFGLSSLEQYNQREALNSLTRY